MKTPAAKDSLVSIPGPRTSISANVLNTWCKRVLAPFPDIARHVEQAELVRLFLCDIVRVIAPLPVIPSYEVNVVAAAVSKAVLPVRTTACGIFPLGLGWQPKDTCWA